MTRHQNHIDALTQKRDAIHELNAAIGAIWSNAPETLKTGTVGESVIHHVHTLMSSLSGEARRIDDLIAFWEAQDE